MERYKEQLKQEYPYRIELHAHTKPQSGCSEVTPEDLIEIYAKKGIHGIAITNHFTYQDTLGKNKEEFLNWYIKGWEDAKRVGTQYGIRIYLGAELRFHDSMNDYLLYGADRETLSFAYDFLGKGLKAYREAGDFSQSVLLQAHPFRDGMTLPSPELLDGIETMNMHPHHNSRVGLAIQYAKERKFSIQTAGSDFHHENRSHEATGILRAQMLPEDSFGLVALLREKNYLFELGGEAIVLP